MNIKQMIVDGIIGGASAPAELVYQNPQYWNIGGTGDRTASIVVTSDLTFLGDLSLLVNGVKTGSSVYFDPQTQAVAGKRVKFQLPAAKIITEATFYQAGSSATHGTWKWQGSNDDSTWFDVGSPFTLGGSPAQVMTELSANTTAYIYYQLLGVSGNTNQGDWPFLHEFELKIANVLRTGEAKDEDANLYKGASPADPLTIATYDGSGQAVHPDVWDFGSGNTWNGYRYWMALTPYPGGDAQYENPSIYGSSDKATWEVPAGLTNPIDPDPAAADNSDPFLWYEAATSTLYCFWREYAATAKIYYSKSTDGVTWSAPTLVLTVATTAIISPAIVHNGSEYRMYYANFVSGTVQYRTAATIDGTWSDPIDCAIVPTIDQSHIDVHYAAGVYYLLINRASNNGSLVLATSTDGINFYRASTDISSSGGGAWMQIRYRACIIKTGTTFDVWFSAHDVSNVWKIGYMSLAAA